MWAAARSDCCQGKGVRHGSGVELASVEPPWDRHGVEPSPAPRDVERNVWRHCSAPVCRKLQRRPAERRRQGSYEPSGPRQQLDVHHNPRGLPSQIFVMPQ